MKRSAKKHTFKPTLEALENRLAPAASISPLQNGVVTVTGDDANNTVTITQNDKNDTLTIVTESAKRVFASDQVTNLNINLNGGDDRLTYGLGGGSDFANGKFFRVDLGSGNDVATFNFADNGAGGLAAVRTGVSLSGVDLDIQAGAGNDVVNAFIGDVFEGLKLTGNMGYGDDHFSAELRNSPYVHYSGSPERPNPSATVIDMEDMNDLVIRDPIYPWITLATVLGGNDDFSVTSAAGVLLPFSDLDVTLKGGDGADTLQFHFDGVEHGATMNVLLDGQGGADSVTTSIALDNQCSGHVNVTVQGGAGDDTLTLRIDNPGTAAVDGFVDGGAGADHVGMTPNVNERNCELIQFWLW